MNFATLVEQRNQFPAARTFPARWHTHFVLSYRDDITFVAIRHCLRTKGFTMNVTLTAWQDSTSCGWCEKTRPCVTTSFDDGFLKNVDLCFGCLQQTLKVRTRQEAAPGGTKSDRTTK